MNAEIGTDSEDASRSVRPLIHHHTHAALYPVVGEAAGTGAEPEPPGGRQLHIEPGLKHMIAHTGKPGLAIVEEIETQSALD